MIAIILGTRPEIIKLSSIISELLFRNTEFYIIHTGQHYSYELDQSFFEKLQLPKPKYNLQVGSSTHAKQTAKIIEGLETVLLKNYPKNIIVQGDTNSVLASAIVASKMNNVKLSHVEAGLRSYDKTMPEEINRIFVDHVADNLFAPTSNNRKILINEGISEDKIYVTGNTIVDTVNKYIKIAFNYSSVFERNNIINKSFFLLTLHRQGNIENSFRLKEIIDSLNKIAFELDTNILFPIHPKTHELIDQQNIKISSKIILIKPVNYFESLLLIKSAKLILTDSGGIQEESCILGTPCVTIRNNTERIETIEIGSNMLTNTSYKFMLSAINLMLSKKLNWKNPFGDGKAGKKIVDIILRSL